MKRSPILLIACTALLFIEANAQETKPKITKESVSAVEPIIRLEFIDAERDSMLENLEENATA